MAYQTQCISNRTAGRNVLNRNRKRRPARGLILLIALGMLALFSLLAVTFVVSAGNSMLGSNSSRVRSRGNNIAFAGTAQKVANSYIRGTTDQNSPAFMHDLLGDIYGRNPIVVKFGNSDSPTTTNPLWCTAVTDRFLKVSLDTSTASAGGLSPNENEYNSRLMTVLEGPLAGQTFRILKYVGYVRRPGNAPILDPNFAQQDRNGSPLAPPAKQLAWADPAYVDPQGSDLEYSILIDISEIQGDSLTGQFTNGAGALENVTKPVSQWLASPAAVKSLFFFSFPQSGYKCVINDAPFNSPGIGIETDPTQAGFGNIDGRHVMSIPSSGPKISPALLTDYNYLSDLGLVTQRLPGIGIPSSGPKQLLGSSNEGVDVADYRDMFLAHQSGYWNGTAWVNNIIPSMHRPEVIHYIASLFGDPAALNPTQKDELLKLIDASSARIMSRPGVNPNFRSNDPNYPRIVSPTPSANDLQTYALRQIIGPWDFDNDGDGVNDSIYSDSGMPATSGPDGKLLKPIVALLVQDLDSRLNVNLHGDRIQGKTAFPAMAGLAGYVKMGELVSQGSGFGPADISLNGLLNHQQALINNPVTTVSSVNYTSFSFFDDRYGARRFNGKLRNMMQSFPATVFADAGLDRMPGRRATGLPANDWASQLFEREVGRNGYRGSRSSVGSTFDVNGNLIFVPPAMDDANPTVPFAVAAPSDVDDDPYEQAALTDANGDDPFSIADLESLLRRYDVDASMLPSRLKERLLQDPRNRRLATDATSPYDVNKLLLDSELLRQITTRSVELTHPNLGAAMVTSTGSVATGVNAAPRSFMEFIKMLHKQRYQYRGAAAINDPELNTAAITSLFPVDITSGLKLDLNRPFGNGRNLGGTSAADPSYAVNYTKDNDFDIDDPQEIGFWMLTEPGLSGSLNPTSLNELENFLTYSAGTPAVGTTEGRYGREVALGGPIPPSATTALTRVRLSSRQALARSLYCLAQLIIPRSYQFPAMSGLPVGSFAWYRVRATAIAQWAVNVVDFRDADVGMTRFEFDIFPFGIGIMPAGGPTATGTPAKLAYWAPDYVHLPTSGVPKELVGVVWGMEMPELLLTESHANHDKRVRDTDADSTGKTTTDPMSADDDFDQYRFPLASLFLELYCPRTTRDPGSTLVPGAPLSLYSVASDGTYKLDVGRMVPSGSFGLQPVWRIGISDHYPISSTEPHPNTMLIASSDPMMNDLRNITHQFSDATPLMGAPAPGNPDAILGSGLYYNLTSTTATPPMSAAFDRMIWFSGYAGQTVPDLPTANMASRIYWNRTTYPGGAPLLAGGSYMVVGPRTETPIGSLENNPITGTPWPAQLVKSALTTVSSIPIRSPSHQMINLFPTSVSTTFLDGTPAASAWAGRIKPALGMVCATNPPNDTAVSGDEWADSFPTGVGINVSLPTPAVGSFMWAETYRPKLRINEDDMGRSDGLLGYGDSGALPSYFPPDSWIKIQSAAPSPATVTGTLPDRPFDYPDPSGGPTLNPILNPPTGTAMYNTGTYQNVRAAYLQRLADPEFGYDPITNPYITVDWISIDLTVFNGEAPAGTDPTDMPTTVAFQSRYKDGDVATSTGKTTGTSAGQPTATGMGGLTYHSPSTGQFRTTVVQPVPVNNPAPAVQRYPSYFKHQLGYASVRTAANPGSSATTLGYLNTGYRGSALATPGELASDLPAQYDGFGPPYANGTGYEGTTSKMTSIAWLNRPFASPHELMMVPLTGPGQFGFYHTVFADDNNQRHPFRFLPSFQTMNAWRTGHNILGPAMGVDVDQRGYWAQPEFQMTTTSGVYTSMPAVPIEADWPLLLEFVETRPPFVDAQTVYNPALIAAAMPAASTTAATNLAKRFLDSRLPPGYTTPAAPELFLGPTLRAPFNMTSSYRAAGKVNLNTIAVENNGTTPFARSTVFKALEYNYLRGSDRFVIPPSPLINTDSTDPLTNQFVETRRGYPMGVPSPFFGTSVAPHLHPQYPTQFAGAYRPALSSNLAPHVEDPIARAKMRSKFGVETTLARSFSLADPSISALPVSAAPTDSMLFSPETVNGAIGLNIPTATAADDANRNAFTRFQREMRLPNLISNQSNVFAMWVTVSLYEWDPVSGFGNEYLDENGLPKRERMFYIIDRSIPVGYKPGENLNTDRTILLKRKLD